MHASTHAVDIADYIARGIIYSRKFLQLWTQREQFYKHFMVVIYNRSVVSCSDTIVHALCNLEAYKPAHFVTVVSYVCNFFIAVTTEEVML